MGMKNTLLLADDMGSNRAFLRRVFEEDYAILEAENGDQVLKLVEENHENIAVVLLDLIMPGKDGYQILAEMNRKGYLADTPVIVVTSDSSKKSEARVLELGAFDLVAKPYDPFIMRCKVQNLVELSRSQRKLHQQVDEMEAAMNATNNSMVNALATITEFRSLESGQHILRIRDFTRILLEDVAESFPEYELDEKQILIISRAAVLHDLGKISIPDAILNKPGRLTKEEFEVMKSHSTAGCSMLELMTSVGDREYMRYAYNICRYHHERWDGRGYPDGLKGDNIPICAQVVAIADVYDALTTKRVYKDAIPRAQAVSMILNGECGASNPRILECFKRVEDKFAECAESYGDNAEVENNDLQTPLPKPRAMDYKISSRQMAAIKYRAMLGYVGGVVIEVDMDSGAYHLIFDEHNMLTKFSNNGTYESFVGGLIDNCMHPDQRAEGKEFYAQLKHAFFEEGIRRSTRRFMVRMDEEGEYFPCECTHLRLDTGDPNQRKAIVIWRTVEEGRNRAGAKVENWVRDAMMEDVSCLLTCRNDKMQTIVDGVERLAAMLGYTSDELKKISGNRLFELMLHEDKASVQVHAAKQLDQSANINVEYRLLRKDGSTIWVRDRIRLSLGSDGVEMAHHMLSDNTPLKEMQEQLRGIQERHNILLNQIDDIVFEWDVVSDNISFSYNFKRQFGYEPICDGFSRGVRERKLKLHPDDEKIVRMQLEKTWLGEECPSFFGAELRIADKDGVYHWRRLRAYAQQLENGKLGYIVGLLTDIEREKHQELTAGVSERDGLTNLYNLAAVQNKIETYIDNRIAGERAAILMIDIDNFSDMNLRYGRMCGDALLMQIAAKIKEVVGTGGIAGRIGGDEFLVLLKNTPNQEMVMGISEKIMEEIAGLNFSAASDMTISCCVGAALIPEDGNTFDDVSGRASIALKNSKGSGCGHFTLYKMEQREEAAVEMTSRIESVDLPDSMGQRLVQYAFHRLYQSGDVRGTLQAILEIVGRKLNVSRVYVYENSPDNKYCRNTFEWCNDGIDTHIDKLGDLYFDTDLEGLRELYNDRGLLLCNDVSTLRSNIRKIAILQDIKSMLHCAMMDGDVHIGFVGFDECVQERNWTNEQIDLLAMVVELTAVFLTKERAVAAGERWENSLEEMVDGLPVCAMVVDAESCDVLFSNIKMQAMIPGMRKGANCRELLRAAIASGSDTIDFGEQRRRSVELSWPGAEASRCAELTMVSWGVRKAVLVSVQ